MKEFKKIVAITHDRCMDGNGAKYAIWKKFGDKPLYLRGQYGRPLPEFEKDLDTLVIFADFSVPSRSDLEALGEACGHVLILDHHQTAREALEGCNHPRVEVVFDMNKSGAVLAWEYLHPDKDVPLLLEFVQDRDLWKFKFDETHAIHAALGTLKGKMKAWDHYSENCWFENTEQYVSPELEHLLKIGDVLLERDKDAVAAQVPENVRVVDFMGYKAGFLNNGNLVSEMGHAIYSDESLKVDIGVCWFVTKDNQVVLSMRSKQDSDIDVSRLCRTINSSGGGHFHAGGTRVSLDEIKEILNGKWYDGKPN